MTTFIQDVLFDLRKTNSSLSDLCIILPSKRAGSFFKMELARTASEAFLSPEIISIEDFIKDLSNLTQATQIELLFELYSSYSKIADEEDKDSFESMLNWGPLLLQDFNEIDRHLADPEAIFNYMSSIKELDHWSLADEQTVLTKQYLSFWKLIPQIYKHLNDDLYNQGKGYQGMLYREAFENLENYIQSGKRRHHIFIGFNALNKAEEGIITELLHSGLAQIYWDIDQTFMDQPSHNAAEFIRGYKRNWTIFNSMEFKWVANNYNRDKNINVIGTSGNVAQCKYIGQTIQSLLEDRPGLDNTAIILGDESLLLPLLNSLPENLPPFNITMGLPLDKSPLTDLFYRLFKVHKNKSDTLYHRDVIDLLSNSFISGILSLEERAHVRAMIDHIKTNNLVYLTVSRLSELCPQLSTLFESLFGKWHSSAEAISKCKDLIMRMKTFYSENKSLNRITLEYLFRFNEVFNIIDINQRQYGHLRSVSALQKLFHNLIRTESVDFEGEPYQGLQIMGMLESRVLDFENIILCSVNENILPAGKNFSSFIPIEVKKQYQLPTYQEKDAIYTYHFYRLLQRSKQITLVYNTETHSFNSGEKSRFIKQLEVERIHRIKEQIITAEVPANKRSPLKIDKNDEIVLQLNKLLREGVSVSGLQKYIRDPISFYKHYILGIREAENVEESLEANTFGTIVHDAMEDCYKPFENSFLDRAKLVAAKSNIDDHVLKHYRKQYPAQKEIKGQNLIYFEVAKRSIANFIDWEIQLLENGHSIYLNSLEQKVDAKIEINGIGFPISITGKLDRIDQFNGQTRIIDYKTGLVTQPNLNLVEWNSLLQDYDKTSKAFQVLLYSLMVVENGSLSAPLEAGIISFRNQAGGFLKFTKKKTIKAKTGHSIVDSDILENFKSVLEELIKEILDKDIPFLEKVYEKNY